MNQENIDAVISEFSRLLAKGHVVKLDEVFNSNGQLERINVIHYTTCHKCEQGGSKS